MLENLKFVQGAVRRNVIMPELEHYRIKDGRVSGFNGHMALSAPLDLAIEAHPKADLFYKALASCKDKVAIHMSPNGRLVIQSGGFKAFVPCLENVAYEAKPEGAIYPAPANFLADMRRVFPFISDDASRTWSMGVLIGEGCYTATNNVIMVQVWDGHPLPRFNCPRFAVSEIIRIGVNPVSIQVSDNSVSFLYADGKWLRTQLYPDQWPFDKMSGILNVAHTKTPVPEGLLSAVDMIAPFAAENASPVYFHDGMISTLPTMDDGTHIDVPGLKGGPIFNIKQLALLCTVVQQIDLESFPRPCIFYGERMRGAILGRSR